MSMRLGTITLLLASIALAAPARPDEAAARSKALFQQAQQTYDRGDAAKALDLFLQAYEAKPLPGFLFNIAQCHRQLHNYERASFYFKRYLALAPNTPNAQVVQDLITEVDGKHAEAEQHQRTEAAAARAQEVEMARIAALQAESAAQTARREEEQRRLELATARALQQKPPAVEQKSGSVLTQWWLWAGVGVVVAGATAGAVYAGTAPSPRPTTLGTDSAR